MSRQEALKIGHVDTGLTLRGGQRQLLLLAQGLRDRGHRQLIVCPEESELYQRASAVGLHVMSLPANDFKHLKGALQLRKRLRQEGLELLHAHDGMGQTVAWMASIGTAVRRIATRRVIYLPRRRLDYRLKYTHTCHAVVAVSEFIGQILRDAGVPPSMINVIPDGIEIPQRLPDVTARNARRRAWKLSEDEFVVGHLGGLSTEKGQDLALKAFDILADKLPNAKLVLGGKISAEDLAASSLAKAVAGGRVLLAGYQENLFEFFSGLDLYIMPSRSEGLGSAALLAMAHSLPVVATRVGGLPEFVEDGKTGSLVEPESPQALADAIVAAASNPERLRELGLNARQRAKEFSADKMVARTEALYRRLLGVQK